MEGLARVIGISRQTIYSWSEEAGKKPFSDILEQIQEEQMRVLVNKGLSGEFNSNITKLVLGKHGLSDKKELAGVDGASLYPEIIVHEYK